MPTNQSSSSSPEVAQKVYIKAFACDTNDDLEHGSPLCISLTVDAAFKVRLRDLKKLLKSQGLQTVVPLGLSNVQLGVDPEGSDDAGLEWPDLYVSLFDDDAVFYFRSSPSHDAFYCESVIQKVESFLTEVESGKRYFGAFRYPEQERDFMDAVIAAEAAVPKPAVP